MSSPGPSQNPVAEVVRLLKSSEFARIPLYRSVLPIALLGSVMLWAAMPGSLPFDLGWLGWLAPVPWLLLVRREQLPGRRIPSSHPEGGLATEGSTSPGGRFFAPLRFAQNDSVWPYLALWLAGFVFWLLTLHWIRLPHPALYLGWFALSAYLAIYLPIFVGLSRVAVHRVGAPLWLAAPVVWTGLELARAHLLTGFLMGSLAHTQVHRTHLIQISDLFGEYGVDFLIVLVASAITCLVFRPRQPWALFPAAFAVTATLIYGEFRIAESQPMDAGDRRLVRIALIQGNSLAEWKADPNRERQIMGEYIKLSEEAVATAKRDGQPIDLLVWPETMFLTGLLSFDPTYELPSGAPYTKEEATEVGRNDLAALVARLGVPVLVGIVRMHFPASDRPDIDPMPQRYNSAALVDSNGVILGTYDKIHRVMFGEYIPFAKSLPFLYRLTPLTGGIEAGSEPVIFELNNRFFAPNICYETVIPHVVRRQAATLVGGSVPADMLINMTNDAWYWGSNELDQHLACGVFRAVETRRPLVIAANGGISAWIDRSGTVREQSPKQEPDVILADVELGYMNSWYLEFGDWFAGVCLTACVVLAIIGIKTRRQGDKETRR
jgi:apolipoprotein N-acyltransferase